MDTRYTMRLAAPLETEEIPAFAERLADIIKGNPAKLTKLLARGTKGLIRATSKDEAERVASVFRRAGLDVEVVPHEQVANLPTPAIAAPVDVEAVGEASATPAEVPEPEPVDVATDPAPDPAPDPTAYLHTATVSAAVDEEIGHEVEVTPLADEAVVEPAATNDAPFAAAADESEAEVESAAFGAPAAVLGEAAAAPMDEHGPVNATPPDITRFDDRVDTNAPIRQRYAVAPPTTGVAARLVGLVGALLLLPGPFLGSAADGIAVDLSDIGGSGPHGLIMIVLGLASLLPIVLGRIHWLWLSAALTAAAWVYALVDSGRANDLGSLLQQWAWLLFPLGALLMLIAAVMPRAR